MAGLHLFVPQCMQEAHFLGTKTGFANTPMSLPEAGEGQGSLWTGPCLREQGTGVKGRGYPDVFLLVP